jgi:hypothetical protein
MTLQELATELGVKESKALELLAEADLSIEEVRVHHVGALKRALTPAPLATTNDRASTGNLAKPIVPAKAASTTPVAPSTTPVTPAAHVETPSVKQSAVTEAVTDLASLSAQMEAQILNKAIAKMRTEMEPHIEAVSDSIAQVGVSSLLEQLESVKKFMGVTVHSPIQMAMAQWEGVTIEAPALTAGQEVITV